MIPQRKEKKKRKEKFFLPFHPNIKETEGQRGRMFYLDSSSLLWMVLHWTLGNICPFELGFSQGIILGSGIAGSYESSCKIILPSWNYFWLVSFKTCSLPYICTTVVFLFNMFSSSVTSRRCANCRVPGTVWGSAEFSEGSHRQNVYYMVWTAEWK